MAKATSTPPTPQQNEDALVTKTIELSVNESKERLLTSPPSLLTLPQLFAFHQASTSSDKLSVLIEALRVQHYSANPRSSIWVDYLFGILCFLKDDAHLCDEKALVVVQIAHHVFEFATTRNSTGFPSIDSVYNDFREQIRVNSIAAPTSTSENSNDVRLSPPEIAQIVKFMSGTFFRHLNAYQYVYEYARETFTHQVEISVEVPILPHSLRSAQLIE